MTYFVTLKLHTTGQVLTQDCATAFERGLLIIATAAFADVLDQGERRG